MTRSDIIERLCRLHPEADLHQLNVYADAIQSRLPLIEAAFRAGCLRGREFKERFQYGKGFGDFWPEMMVLKPAERGYVMDELKRHLGISQ